MSRGATGVSNRRYFKASIMSQNILLVVTVAAILSTSMNGTLAWASKQARYSSKRDDLTAVQSAHERPTPRLGGFGIFLGFSAASLLLGYLAEDTTPILLLISALPIFLAGLLEDTGRHISPRHRLFAAFISAALAIISLNTWIGSAGLNGFDLLMTFAPFAVLVTLVWSAGVCNAFNLIDGVNGLSGFIAFSISAALGFVAWGAGDILMSYVALALAISVLGFLVFNWPSGSIFLGDAGAYTIGHILTWISILIAARNPGIGYAALSLMFFWPVADTFLAMWRRSRRRSNMMHPDYLHAHQFVMRAMQLRWKTTLARANSATAVVLAPFFILPVLAGILLAERPHLAFVTWIIYGAVFLAFYLIGIRWVRRQGWRKRRWIQVQYSSRLNDAGREGTR